MTDKKNYYRWVILFVTCFAILSPNYSQYQLSPLASQLISMLDLSTSQFASIFSAPMIPAIFLGLIAGLLVDKLGIKTIISIGLIISAAGAFLRIYADSYSAMLACMVLCGVGATVLNANGLKIFGSWFKPEHVGALMGVFLASATVGMTLGIGTTAMFSSISSAYKASAAVAIVGALLWIVAMKTPGRSGDVPASQPIMQSLNVVMKSRGVWLVGVCLMFTLGANIVVSSFLPAALNERGVDLVNAGLLASIMTLGDLAGCLIGPFIVAWTGRIKPVIFIFGLIGAITIAFAWQIDAKFLLWSGLALVGITIGGLISVLMAIPLQLSEIGTSYAGTAGGFACTLELLGAVVIPTYIITPIAGADYTLIFLLGGLCMIILSVVILFLPETGWKSGENRVYINSQGN